MPFLLPIFYSESMGELEMTQNQVYGVLALGKEAAANISMRGMEPAK